MSKFNLLLLLLFAIVGLFWGARCDSHGDGLVTANKPQDSSDIQNSNNASPSLIQEILGIPEFLSNFLQKMMLSIYHFFRPVVRGMVFFVIDTLDFIFSSDDKRVSVDRNSVTDIDHPQTRNNGVSLMGMMSSAFMMPFKWVIGSLRNIPISSILNNTESFMEPLGEFVENPVVKAATNVSLMVFDHLGEMAWNFTKVNVLPRVDDWITTAKESNTLPDVIIKYLTELQTLYHIFQMFGMA